MHPQQVFLPSFHPYAFDQNIISFHRQILARTPDSYCILTPATATTAWIAAQGMQRRGGIELLQTPPVVGFDRVEEVRSIDHGRPPTIIEVGVCVVSSVSSRWFVSNQCLHSFFFFLGLFSGFWVAKRQWLRGASGALAPGGAWRHTVPWQCRVTFLTGRFVAERDGAVVCSNSNKPN